MSIDCLARLVIGVPADELLYEDVVELNLETFQPFYDAPIGLSLVGLRVFSSVVFGYTELPDSYKIEEVISTTFAKFFALTGKVGKLYIITDCY